MSIRNEIKESLKKSIPERIEVDVSLPEGDGFGHYATNVAFVLGGVKKTSPLEVAKDLVKILEKHPTRFFQKIEVAPPGFINFWLTNEALQNELKEIIKKKKKYGSGVKKKEKIQIEFVSANPTGPLTLANGRGGFLGDVLSNVFEKSGYAVEREYYVNDTGNQIVTFGKSLLAALDFIPYEETFYAGSYVKEWAKNNRGEIQKNKNAPLKIGQTAAKNFLKKIKEALGDAGIRFDRWTSEEKHIHKKNFVNKTLEIFKKEGLVYEKEGATWFQSTKYGDDKDRVLITSDGFPTYFLADSGHYLETKKRGFDAKINILGPDHHGYVRRIQAAATTLGVLRSEIIVTQAVRLMQDGVEIKMSKRSGMFVTLQELVKEVGIDAARFFFLMHAPETHMDFDLSLAKERSQKNPAYYAQYAYVRALSILERSKKSIGQTELLTTREDIKLLRKLAEFPEVIEDTVRDYEVRRLTRYATELAREFHNFYEKERVVGVEESLMRARLELIRGVVIVFENLFGILGISAPQKM